MSEFLDYEQCKEKTIEEDIDKLLNEGSVSSYEYSLETQNRIIRRKNMSYDRLVRDIQTIFKEMPEDVFIDRLEKFKKIKKRILGKHLMKENTLRDYLLNDKILREKCEHIRMILEHK